MEFLRTHKLVTTALFSAIASIIYNLLTPIWYSYCSSLDYSSYINIIYNFVPTLLFATLLIVSSMIYITFILKQNLRIGITILLSILLSPLFLFVIKRVIYIILEFTGLIYLTDVLELFWSIFFGILFTPLSFLACIYVIMLVHCPPATPEQTAAGSGYRSMAKHVLLLIFTFGIYNLIWIYRTTAYLNQINDEPPRNPTYKLLLCLFVPFYEVYWVYKSSQRIDRLAGSKGIHSNISTLCTVLTIFLWIVPPIIMQDKINTVEKPPLSTPPVQHTDVADGLKKYKELLDMGAISQDEFDKKKQQLLNL